MSYLKKRIQAFGYAFNGLFAAFKTESHLKIHVLATAIVIIAGIYFKITKAEWLAISICCGSVLAAELFNSAIEKLCDIVSPQLNPKIKFIKDVSAAAVLILSLMSICVAVLIFASTIFKIIV
jgi:diacylglycerol kinase